MKKQRRTENFIWNGDDVIFWRISKLKKCTAQFFAVRIFGYQAFDCTLYPWVICYIRFLLSIRKWSWSEQMLPNKKKMYKYITIAPHNMAFFCYIFRLNWDSNLVWTKDIVSICIVHCYAYKYNGFFYSVTHPNWWNSMYAHFIYEIHKNDEKEKIVDI